jgi:hypothetical protein
MLYICTSVPDSYTGKKEYTWHIGNVPPGNYNSHNVTSVQADGDELTYLIQTFKNIPYHKTSAVQVWLGDYAKFIAANLS